MRKNIHSGTSQFKSSSIILTLTPIPNLYGFNWCGGKGSIRKLMKQQKSYTKHKLLQVCCKLFWTSKFAFVLYQNTYIQSYLGFVTRGLDIVWYCHRNDMIEYFIELTDTRYYCKYFCITFMWGILKRNQKKIFNLVYLIILLEF